MKIALIVDNEVVSIKIGDVNEFPGWVDVTGEHVGVGFTDNGDGTFTDNRVPDTTSLIRRITTKAFFRRLNFQERKVLRNSTLETVADLREDLQRGSSVDLDDILEQQLLDTGLLDQSRIDELLGDGTPEETEL